MECEREAYKERCLQFPPRLQQMWSKHTFFLSHNDGKTISKGTPPGGNSPSGKRLQKPYEDHLKGTCTNASCDSWRPPVCQNKTQAGCRVCEGCLFFSTQRNTSPAKQKNPEGWRTNQLPQQGTWNKLVVSQTVAPTTINKIFGRA